MCEKGLLRKLSLISKIYDVTTWGKNSYSTHIAQYLKQLRQLDNEIWLVIEYNVRNIFL